MGKKRKSYFFKVNYRYRQSWALRKEHAMGEKKSCYVDGEDRKDAGILHWLRKQSMSDRSVQERI